MRLRLVLPILTIVAGALVALPAFPAVGAPPDARLVRLPVAWQGPAPGAVQAASSDAWRLSEEIAADDTVLVGADWGGDDAVEVQLRTREDGVWGPWTDLELGTDDAPDPGTDEGRRAARYTASAPVWIGEVEAYQLRSRGPRQPEVTLHNVEISGGSGLGYVDPQLRAAAAAQAAPAAPNILSRSAWDPQNQCRRRDAPYYSTDVRFAVVHHTAGSNDYSPEQADDRILADCLYHVNSRGWDDLAYNFVVDKYGRIYEGRTGGITEPVQGGHALGFNGGSTGVVLLGTFTTVEPPAVMLNALRDLLAWKLDLHHVDPHGTTREIAGGNTGVYSAGELATLPTIIGHRDVRTTSCPGSAAYAFLPWLRQAVAEAGGLKLYGGPPATEDQPVLGQRPLIDVDLSAPAAWRLDVLGPSGAAVRSTSGSGTGFSLRWDLRDAAGREVAPGTYRARVTASGATPIETTFTVRGSTERIGHATAADRSAAASRWAFQRPQLERAGWPQSSRVVIASSETTGAAYLAAPLAATYDAPVLLSPAAGLPSSVAAEIDRLGATTAYLVGGASELSTQVEADLRAAGITSLERFVGDDLYHTSAKVALRILERERPSEAVIVLGEGPDAGLVGAEAATGAAWAAAFDRPLLYVKPTELPYPVQWLLEQQGWSRLIVVGGKNVLSGSVKSAASAAARGAPIYERPGSDRYETARLAAEQVFAVLDDPSRDPNVVSKGETVVVASGESPVDAIPAAAAASERGATFTLVPQELGTAPGVQRFFQDRASTIVGVTGVGATDTLTQTALGQVDGIIRSAGPHTAAPEQWAGAVDDLVFDDIAGITHQASIERLAEQQVTDGCDGDSYCPGADVTRGQMAKFIALSAGLEPVGGAAPFPDVPADHPFAGFIAALVEADIAGGYTDGTYGPGDPVTRGQMAKFIATAAGLGEADGTRFSDVSAEDTFAGFIEALAAEGIVGGYADGTYRPGAPVTRAQMATFLVNAFFPGS